MSEPDEIDDEESEPADGDEERRDSDAPPTDPERPLMPTEGVTPESAVTKAYMAPREGGDHPDAEVPGEIARAHLKGLLEALIFVSEKPVRAADLCKTTAAPLREVKELLTILKDDYAPRGIQLDEVAGGWIFRTSAAYAPFVRDMTKLKPVKLTRAQIESLAILAYRQPITRPEIDEIRGVDSGPVLKVLLDRDLVRILGKKDEPGRPLIYGTTQHFLELFGLKSLRDLPTLREFTELNEDSRRLVERELGDVLDDAQEPASPTAPPLDPRACEDPEPHDTLRPPPVDFENEVERTNATPFVPGGEFVPGEETEWALPLVGSSIRAAELSSDDLEDDLEDNDANDDLDDADA